MKLRLSPSRAGFTLMEIMLVVAIIALLAGLLINSLKTNLVMYNMKAGNFPSTEQGIKALVTRPDGEPRPLSWSKIIDEVPNDPWGHPFYYERPGKKHPDSFDIYSAGKDGKPGTEDDVWPNQSDK